MQTEKRRVSEKELRERATDYLISQQRCSKHRDHHYNIICYGADINMLDSCRKWIFDEEMAIHGDQTKAFFAANKTVLYVNEAELKAKMRELREGGL